MISLIGGIFEGIGNVIKPGSGSPMGKFLISFVAGAIGTYVGLCIPGLGGAVLSSSISSELTKIITAAIYQNFELTEEDIIAVVIDTIVGAASAQGVTVMPFLKQVGRRIDIFGVPRLIITLSPTKIKLLNIGPNTMRVLEQGELAGLLKVFIGKFIQSLLEFLSKK